jgi:hypothetical protein
MFHTDKKVIKILWIYIPVDWKETLEKKWEYNGILHQLCIYFKKAYDSVTTEVLYNIVKEFCKTIKLIKLIKTYKWNVKSA